MNNKASITALMSSFGRAFHAENEDHPVFRDDFARKMMTQEEYAAVEAYVLGGAAFFEPELPSASLSKREILRRIVNVHIAPSPLCRSAYAENTLKKIMRHGMEQYVILGAGLDSFAFREAEFMATHRVFEVDHPLTQADKRMRIARAGLTVPENLRFVPMDFTCDCLSEKLMANGFDVRKKAFFSWLGVSYYLSEADIDRTLGEIAEICASGSGIVFDYPDEGFFSAQERRVQNTIMMAQAGGEAMKTALSIKRLQALLTEHGFCIRELLKPEDIQEKIIDAAFAEIKAFEHVNYCFAVKEDA